MTHKGMPPKKGVTPSRGPDLAVLTHCYEAGSTAAPATLITGALPKKHPHLTVRVMKHNPGNVYLCRSDTLDIHCEHLVPRELLAVHLDNEAATAIDPCPRCYQDKIRFAAAAENDLPPYHDLRTDEELFNAFSTISQSGRPPREIQEELLLLHHVVNERFAAQ